MVDTLEIKDPELRERVAQLKMLDPVMHKDNRVGTAKQAVIEALQSGDYHDGHALAQAFEEASQEEKNAGKLIGKLMMARGNAQVDNAFAWWAEEYNGGESLSELQKNLALTATIQQIAGGSPDGNRILRKVLVTLNTK